MKSSQLFSYKSLSWGRRKRKGSKTRLGWIALWPVFSRIIMKLFPKVKYIYVIAIDTELRQIIP